MSGKEILIVEDEGLIALNMAEILEREGYQVSDMLYAGHQVLPAVEKNKPDLILMDIGLQGAVDGIEAARQIRKKFSIPLIFVTAYTAETTLKKMNDVAPAGIIHKPFEDTDLLKLIYAAIGKN